MRRSTVEAVSVRAFRNLRCVDLELGPQLNVFWGDNGQGKTNLLEAVYVLATSRSFRTSRLTELVAVGETTASLRARIVEGEPVDGAHGSAGDIAREQSVGLQAGLRAVRLDGKRPPTLAAYAVRTPVVVFHPGSLSLAGGSGGDRRRMLDRLALYRSPASLGDAESYAKALRARQKVLETRGDDAQDLGSWEELLARHGIALSEARAAAAEELAPRARAVFSSLSRGRAALDVRYHRASPATIDEYLRELARRRQVDRLRGWSSLGPQRDDILLSLGDKPVRGMASQGQQRAVVLSLQLAEIAVVGAARGVEPVVLLDDVSSELDRETTAALFGALLGADPYDGGAAVLDVARAAGQVLLTTTRPELIDLGRAGNRVDRRDFRVEGGEISPVDTPLGPSSRAGGRML